MYALCNLFNLKYHPPFWIVADNPVLIPKAHTSRVCSDLAFFFRNKIFNTATFFMGIVASWAMLVAIRTSMLTLAPGALRFIQNTPLPASFKTGYQARPVKVSGFSGATLGLRSSPYSGLNLQPPLCKLHYTYMGSMGGLT
jgi:hypothetical protein